MNATAYFDGGARGTPGPAACAAVLSYDGRTFSTSKDLGVKTNNEAEWEGLMLALEMVTDIQLVDGDILVLCSDSRLVVEQALGRWRVRAQHLRIFRDQAQLVARKFREAGIRVTIQHVPRDQNKEADAAVTQLLDEITGRKRQS